MTTTRNFDPEHRIDMYQARCTNCGYIETEYGDFSAWTDPDTSRESVVENGDWHERWVVDSRGAGTVESHLEELLCPDCQECEVCSAKPARTLGDHVVCDDHEDHDFAVTHA